MVLVKAAHILRRDMLKTDFIFKGNLSNNRQVELVPESLISMISIILHGSGMVNKCENTQTVISLAQFMQYSCHKRQRVITPTTSHHHKSRETPLSVYIRMLLHF